MNARDRWKNGNFWDEVDYQIFWIWMRVALLILAIIGIVQLVRVIT